MEKGWYNDPYGRHLRRYFDGSDWTRHVQSELGEVLVERPQSVIKNRSGAEGTYHPAPTSVPAGLAPVASQSKSRKTKWILIGVGIAAIVGIGNALGGLSNSDALTGGDGANAEIAVNTTVPTPRHPANLVVVGDFQPPAEEGETVKVVWFGRSYQKEIDYEDVRYIDLVVRNNTQNTVSGVKVSAIVRDSGGGLLEGSEQLNITPEVLEPGAWGIGTLQIKNLGNARIGTLTFNVDYTDGDDCNWLCPTYADLSEITQDGDTIKGLLTAPVQMTTAFGVRVTAYCFGRQGNYLGTSSDRTAQESLAKGESTVFVIKVAKSDCPNFALEAYSR